MNSPDLHDDLRDLAARLPDPPATSLATINGRARRRHRRRLLATTLAAVAVVVGVGVGAQRLDGPPDLVAPGIVDAFGPVLAEVHGCAAALPECPDLDPDEVLARIVGWLDEQPGITVLETHQDRPVPAEDDSSLPTTPIVEIRIAQTTAPSEFFEELVSLPVVYGVSLGTATQPPAALRDAGPPSDVDDGRTLGRVAAPVQGRSDPVIFEAWEPAGGTICHGQRTSAACTLLTIRSGKVSGMFSTPHDGEPGCLSTVTGPGVDHVRVSDSDGTRLEVASTPLRPHLTVLTLHVACWTAPNALITGDLVAPNGDVLDQLP